MSLKILIISDAWHPQVNGVVRTYEYLQKELKDIGHHVEVIGPSNFNFIMPMPFYREIKLVLFPDKRLKLLINDYKPDKIHIATEGPLGWAARRYCLKNNKKFTTCYHTQFPDYIAKRFEWLPPSLYNIIHRYAITLVRHFHTQSSNLMVPTPSIKEQLLSWGFKTPITLLSRGVDTTTFNAGNKIAYDVKHPIALYVGRISVEKNINDFLDMKWTGSKIIVGDGPLRHKLEKQYPKAIFVGKKSRKELADYYRSSDIFVFPSKTDTFGIVIIEALACGLPVAAYNVIGPKDIITKNYLGALDDNDLSKAVSKALKQADKEKCSQYIKENYKWKTAAKQFISAI